MLVKLWILLPISEPGPDVIGLESSADTTGDHVFMPRVFWVMMFSLSKVLPFVVLYRELFAILFQGPNIIIKQSDEILKNMNDWCKKHHGESGLTEQVRASDTNLQKAEFEMLGFVRQHTAPGYCPLAGNSVHVDKVFLQKYMPLFMHHLHYRIVDVSTLKELCR